MRRGIIFSIILSFLVAAAAALLNSSPARADHLKKEFAGYTKYVWVHEHYDINPDGTDVETQSWALQVLSEQGVAEAQKASVSYSDRLKTMEVVSAYTLKKDGRKINLPPTNFQDESNSGKGTAAPMFSDIRTKTVAFPDVAVGDTVVFSYKLTEKEATFPGNFSMMQSFSKFQVYDDVQIGVSAPVSLGLHVYSRGVEGGEAPSSGGRRNWAWTYKNQHVATPEVWSVSALDYGPLIVASTFKDYGALAAAYDARAKTKVVQTDRIRKLANDLTQSAHTPRDQAKTLYDWVAQNIKYARNSVGIGEVVPHDADTVLANRMGDCKDHTTLLQSLLAVKGIATSPALINAADAYTLPEAPPIEIFDHVITYIPSLDLYVDPTSEYTAFGSLPNDDAGKPVVQTVNFPGIKYTPMPLWNRNGSSSTTVLKINPDGSGEGETNVASTGDLAETARYWAIYLQPNLESLTVQRALAANGFTGTGTLIKGDVKDRTDSYSWGGKFKVSDAINLPGPGAMEIKSPFDGLGGIGQYLSAASDPDRTVNFVCTNGYVKNVVTMKLPKDVKVMALPKNAEIKVGKQTYKATYEQKGQTITAVRQIEDRTIGPVCSPAVGAEYRKFAVSIRKQLRSQILYQ